MRRHARSIRRARNRKFSKSVRCPVNCAGVFHFTMNHEHAGTEKLLVHLPPAS
jgi:hypothetical protein